MSLLRTAPVPGEEPLVNGVSKETPWHLIMPRWVDWLVALTRRLDESPRVLLTKRVLAQAATILTTPFALGLIGSGLYRVSYRARIVQPATTSSDLTITIGWTDDGVSCSESGAVMTGNATNTTQSGTVILRSQQGTPITFAALRVSVGATPMLFEIEMSVEALN